MLGSACFQQGFRTAVGQYGGNKDCRGYAVKIIFETEEAIDAVAEARMNAADIARQALAFPGVTINGIRVCVEDNLARVSAPYAIPRKRFTQEEV